ncbi:hypothetical protein [Paenibacillus cymbidii]|uniref:hypothetical protein n=1 Tax=Paenibacillus cymbidii TaxID=1639034 RepID=UPI001081E34E|nr:hypothetical protein [Paenibacillus cymbidii]
MPNENKIDLATENARKPAEGTLNSSGNTLEQHASNAVSEVQTAINQAISSISESNAAINSQVLETARQQLSWQSDIGQRQPVVFRKIEQNVAIGQCSCLILFNVG